MGWAHVCTERSVIDRSKSVTSANAIYRCEELEDAASVYDDIQESQYDALKDNTVYLELISDTGSEPPLPSPRPVTQSQDQDYRGLNEQKPDQINLQMLKDETEGIDNDIEAPNEDEDHDTKPQEQDQQTESKDQDTDIQNQTHDLDTESEVRDHDYEGLKEEQPGHIYRLLDETEGTDQDTGVPEQDKGHGTNYPEEDQQSESKQQDPDKNNQYQTHVQDTESEVRDHDYEGLKEEQPGHIYHHVLTDETKGTDQDTGVPDQDKGHGTNYPEEDQQSECRNQDQNINTQYQTHDQYTESQDPNQDDYKRLKE